jgi:hypothetical protein
VSPNSDGTSILHRLVSSHAEGMWIDYVIGYVLGVPYNKTPHSTYDVYLLLLMLYAAFKGIKI